MKLRSFWVNNMGRPKKHVHVVNVSGGRSSGYLAYLMKHKAKNEDLKVVFIFCDTGAEHPETYEFIRRISKHLDIDITCLRTKTILPLGSGNTYQKVSVKYIRNDLKPWADMCKKYGIPSIVTPFCTDRLKLVPLTKYCEETFGKGNYTTYIGIRADESRRLKPRKDVVYLADISDFEKQDVLDWWAEKSWDLKIPEHLGNCVFCIKKHPLKLIKAILDEPQLTNDMLQLLKDPANRPSLPEIYRDYNTLESLIAKAHELDPNIISDYIKNAGMEDTGSCSESCEAIP